MLLKGNTDPVYEIKMLSTEKIKILSCLAFGNHLQTKNVIFCEIQNSRICKYDSFHNQTNDRTKEIKTFLF